MEGVDLHYSRQLSGLLRVQLTQYSAESQREYVKTGDYYRIIEYKGDQYVT